MKILFITQYFAPEIGAAPVRLTALADALQSSGHLVTVVTSLPNYPTGRTFPGYRRRLFARETRDSGVEIFRVWTYPATGSGSSRYLNYLSFLATSPLLLFRVGRPDVMFVESPPLTTAVIGWIFGLVKRAPMVLNIADLWPDAVVELGLVSEAGPTVKLARILERWSYRKAAMLSHATLGIGERLREKGIEQHRLIFVPNGADTNVFTPKPRSDLLASELGLTDRKVMLFAGTHSVAAGMEVLLETAELLRDNPSIVLLVVGDGPTKQDLVDESQRRGLRNLMFLDPVQPERVAELYSISVAGLVTLVDSPVAREMRPAKMFPPLACGKPVIYSGSGEGAELIRKHDMGVVVGPGDAQAFAASISDIAGDSRLAKSMGENGREFVERNVSWLSTALRWAAEVDNRLGEVSTE